MEAFTIYNGTERGVNWTVDTKTKVNPVIITVNSDKGKKHSYIIVNMNQYLDMTFLMLIILKINLMNLF